MSGVPTHHGESGNQSLAACDNAPKSGIIRTRPSRAQSMSVTYHPRKRFCATLFATAAQIDDLRQGTVYRGLSAGLAASWSRSGQPWSRSGQPWSRSGQPWSRSGQPWSRSGQPWSRSGQPWSRSGQPDLSGLRHPAGSTIGTEELRQPIRGSSTCSGAAAAGRPGTCGSKERVNRRDQHRARRPHDDANVISSCCDCADCCDRADGCDCARRVAELARIGPWDPLCPPCPPCPPSPPCPPCPPSRPCPLWTCRNTVVRRAFSTGTGRV
jgi:hypothetical protein